MIKIQNLNTYIGKVALIIYSATLVMVSVALILDVINYPQMLLNNLLALGFIFVAAVLYFLHVIKMSFSFSIIFYAVLFNIILGFFNISHGAYQVHFFMRNSLFIIYMITVASLLSHKLNGIIISIFYLVSYISLTLITGDPFLKGTILIQLSLFISYTAGIYYFINAFEKSVHELGENSKIILKQNELLNETNTLLTERQERIEAQSEELGIQKEELEAQKEELTQINEELHEALATKDKFFSIIAHDLRNPLCTLIGFSEHLYKDGEELDEEKKNEICKAIYDSSLSAFNLLENLLIWARMQMGSIKIYPESVKLYNVVQGASLLHENIRTRKNIIIDNLIDEKQEVLADKYMLTSVVNNLISNALKFTYTGGTIQISSGNSDNKNVEVCISDNGTGISQDNISKLFRIDKSFSAPGTNDEKGTGLGLLLCKEFIELNGGRIWVESEPGRGSNFFFTLKSN